MDLILDILLILWYIGIVIISGDLWRRGGDGMPLERNPGVPILMAAAKWISIWPLTSWYIFLYIPITWAMIRMFSYGIKSPVHKFWVWFFGRGEDGNDITVEFSTRTTCAAFWTLPAAIFAVASGGWTLYWLYVFLMSATIGLVGATAKEVEISERAVGASLAMAIII